MHMRKLSWIPTVTIVVASLTLDGVVPDVLSAADATYYVLQDKTGKHRIVYEMANMLGKSQFNYNGHVFSGGEIRRKSVTDLGETISVTINKGQAGDSTTLTLVLPRVVVKQDERNENQNRSGIHFPQEPRRTIRETNGTCIASSILLV